MQQLSYQFLQANPELLHFVRFNPVWYRYIARDPGVLNELPLEAKKFYGKTFPQKLEKWSNQAEMIGMFLHFADALKD